MTTLDFAGSAAAELATGLETDLGGNPLALPLLPGAEDLASLVPRRSRAARPGTARCARRSWPGVVAAADVIALVLAFVLASGVRISLFGGDEGPGSLGASILREAPYAPAYMAAMWAYGLYGRSLRRVGRSWVADFGRFLHAAGTGAILCLAGSAAFSRLVGGTKLGWVEATCMSAFTLATVPAFRGHAPLLLGGRARTRSRVVVIAAGSLVPRILERLRRLPDVDLVGVVGDGSDVDESVRRLGDVADLVSICEDLSVDRVLACSGLHWPEELPEIVRQLPPSVHLSIVSGFSELVTWRSQVEDLLGLAVLDVPPAQLNWTHRAAKRAVDLVLSCLALVVLAPFLVAIAVAIKVTSRGPVLFRQVRTGQDGRPFRIAKFRTMSTDAEVLLADLTDLNESDGLFKIRKDPRVTSIGAFLRRTSLDEIPQLLNVLRGEMSLVGPRPLVPEESARIDGWAARRFQVKPGMTGLWQVSGRSDLSFEELRRLDYVYAASWSLWWDLRILLQTPESVIRGRGAY